MSTLIIEKKDLAHNIQKIKEHASINGQNDKGENVKIIAVIKANAYGLDMKQYVEFLIDNGINYFAVSTVEEALRFRKLGFKEKLLMLSSSGVKEDVEKLIENNVTISIGSIDAMNVANEIAKEKGKKIKVHLKIDTGFGRYGFMYYNREEIIESIKKSENIEIEGTFTHFSNAFYDDKYTKKQFKRFIDCIEVLKMNEINVGMLHVCNSSAFIKFPQMHLNAVRVGSAFLGRLSFQNNIGLKKIGKLESKVAEIKTIRKGEYIGYSNAYKTKKDLKIAVIPCGYVEGFNLKSGKDMFRKIDTMRNLVGEIKNLFKKQSLYVQINGKKYEVLGRIGTYHIVVDIKDDKVMVGDKAEMEVNSTIVDSMVDRKYI